MITLEMIEKYEPCDLWVKSFKKLTKDGIDIVELLKKLEECEVCKDVEISRWHEDGDEAFKYFIYEYILRDISKEDFNRVIEYHKQNNVDLRWVLESYGERFTKQEFLEILEYFKKDERKYNYGCFDSCTTAFEFCSRRFTKQILKDIMQHYQKLISRQPVHERGEAKQKAFGKAFSYSNSMRSLPFFWEVVGELGIEDPYPYEKEKFVWPPSVEQQRKNWEDSLALAKSQNLYKSY